MSAADDPRIELLRARVRDIPDFPKPGILFRDLTPLMADASTFRQAVDLLGERVAAHRPELIVAIESRGFIFGAPLAAALGVGFVPVRKPGKLPHKTARRDYAL
ncbi:MAG: purine phosphoribosyltransferase family protein, partial [Pseudomonadota bacterium]